MASPEHAREAWLGPGISYRRRYHQELLQLSAAQKTTPAGPLVLEILPDHFFANPEPLAALAEQYCLVFHDVGLSLATAGLCAVRRQRLRQLKTLVELARPVLFSDHLALTSSPEGLDGGHLLPAWYTQETLAQLTDNIQRCQDLLQCPIALENIAWPFVLPAPMREPEFISLLVQRTGCGLLLDLANLLCNQRNFPAQSVNWLEEYPCHAVQQIHLAGGIDQHGWWLDSHSTAVEDASLRLLCQLPPCPVLRTIVIERDSALPPLAVLMREAQQAAHLWRRRRPGATV
ncbi:MAG: DUF692 family multinuclear iron-containing protein [Candidatus Tectimicrobiota bacterium]